MMQRVQPIQKIHLMIQKRPPMQMAQHIVAVAVAAQLAKE
jgi:hypothetical protein